MLSLGGKLLCSKTLRFFSFTLLIAFASGQVSEPLSLVFEERTEFLLFTSSEGFVFDDALAECGNFDSFATLARVDTLEEFNFIISALEFDTLSTFSPTDFYLFWIGLRNENSVQTNVLTDRYSFVDGIQTNNSFFEQPSALPWAVDSPLEFGFDCVVWASFVGSSPEDKRWVDNRCEKIADGFLCRREFIKIETQPLSVVVDDTEFLYFDQAANFDVASKKCSDFDPDSTLARVDNEEDFDFILKAFNFSILNDQNRESFRIWIGLNNQQNLGSGSQTSTFSYVDGLQDNVTFFQRRSQKPWANLQPVAVRTTEQCVSWETNAELGPFWRVQECKALLPGFLCRRDVKKVDVEPLSFVLDDKIEFLLFNQPSSFEVATQGCKRFNPGASLASIDTDAEFDLLAESFTNVSSDSSIKFATWIGLREKNSDNLEDPGDRFVYIDRTETNSSFFEVGFQKPWEVSQPSNTPGIQDCVSWELAEDQSFSWFANDCREIKPSFLCRMDIEEANTENEADNTKSLLYVLLAIIWLLWLMLVALWIRICCAKSKPQ